MSEPVDVYWSFRSPYSYLVTPDLQRLQADYDVDVRMRIVYPIAVRNPDLLFDPAQREKVLYIVRDSRRRAEFLGLPFGPPRPDPIVQDMQTLGIAKEQPYIHRLSAMGVEAARRGNGVEFVTEISALIFGGTEGWNEGDHLRAAAARAGLAMKGVERRATPAAEVFRILRRV